MNPLKLYASFLADFISQGNLTPRDRISSLGVKPAFDRILTKKYVTKVWQLTELPVNFDMNLIPLIRNEMHRLSPNVRTITYTSNSHVKPDVTSEDYSRKMSSAEESYNNYKTSFDQLSGTQKRTGASFRIGGARRINIGAKELSRLKDRLDSYNYVYDRATDGSSFFSTRFFIHAQAESNWQLARYRQNLMAVLGRHKIHSKEIRGGVSAYLRSFGPATYVKDQSIKLSEMLMSDENVASTIPFRSTGMVGGSVGGSDILMGSDVLSGAPLMLDFFKSPQGQIIGIDAKTGFGKTALAQFIAIGLTSFDVHVNALDIKGNEWNLLSPFIRSKVIGMDDSQSTFVNTLRMDDMLVTRENAKSIMQMAIKGTSSLYSLMVNMTSAEGNVVDLDDVLEKAIEKTMSAKDIDHRYPKSLANSRDLKLIDPLPVLLSLSNSTSWSVEKRRVARLAYDRISGILKGSGRWADAFRNEITLQEVLDTPLVIYSFNKNTDQTLDQLDTIRVFMVQHLSSKKQRYRKQLGLHTAAFYEELQRSEQFGDLLTAISHDVTGSRSNNALIFLLMNSLNVFDNPKARAISSNITTWIVGNVNPQDKKTLIEDFGCHDIAHYLDMITGTDKVPRIKERNVFAIKYDTGADTDTCLFKVNIPPNIERAIRTKDVGLKRSG